MVAAFATDVLNTPGYEISVLTFVFSTPEYNTSVLTLAHIYVDFRLVWMK